MSYLKNISHISYHDDINHHKLSYDNIGFLAHKRFNANGRLCIKMHLFAKLFSNWLEIEWFRERLFGTMLKYFCSRAQCVNPHV